MTEPKKLSPFAKLVLDFAPLAVFFLGYRMGDVMLATKALIAATLICLALIYIVERKLALAPLITGIIVAIFGGLTVWLDNEQFIKIKPTLINGIFAATLLIGALGFRRGLLKPVLGLAIDLSDEGWLILSRRWGFFFLFLAGVNEYVWRHYPTDFWVDFKVFGMFSMTMLFALAQFRLIQHHGIQK